MYIGILSPKMENQIEKKMENEIGTVVIDSYTLRIFFYLVKGSAGA